MPDQVIQPYDTTIAQRRPFGKQSLSPREFGGWLYGQVQAWRARYATPSQGPLLIVLAGQEYWRWLVEYRLEFSVPLDGLSIGQRIRWLQQHTAVCRHAQATSLTQPSLFPDQRKP